MPHAPDRIRPLAICVFTHSGRILVAEGYDPVKGETFYRPLGGAIEFGERGEDTLTRELREELDADVVDLRFLGSLENIFVYNGQRGHEIVLVYDGAFGDPAIYERSELRGVEHDGSTFRAVWKSLDELRSGAAPLYPDGLLLMLRKHA
ncbi:MAG: NUDIX hydrolase [bacterium]